MMAPLEYKCCIHTKRKNQNTVSTIDSKDEDDFREGNSYWKFGDSNASFQLSEHWFQYEI